MEYKLMTLPYDGQTNYIELFEEKITYFIQNGSTPVGGPFQIGETLYQALLMPKTVEVALTNEELLKVLTKE